MNGDATTGGEFHCVVDQIDEHLAEAGDVTHDPRRDVFGDMVGEVEVLAGGLHGEEVERLLDGRAQIERQVLHLHLAGFDIGEVQDVVDDGE